DIPGEPRPIHQGRALEPRTQLTAQRREARKIIGQRHRGADERSVRFGRKIEQTHMIELTQAGAADARSTHAGQNRHAHPQGVETGGMSIVRKRIETEIDTVVGTQVLRSRSKLDESDSFRLNMLLLETLQ